jgi:hypothetical protein
MMKSFVISTLGEIIKGVLGLNSERSKFIIKCPECECLVELEDGFSKSSGDIEVVNGDGFGENSENIVSIRCNKCGNRIVSSEY